MSVVERIEKYTSREREKLDKGDAPLMRHLLVDPMRDEFAICGARLPASSSMEEHIAQLNVGGLDCNVCAEIAKARGWL